MKLTHYIFLIFTIAGAACNPTDQKSTEAEMKVNDPHSFARPQEAVITHLNWSARIDFDNQIISGQAVFDIELADNAKEIIFDTKGLSIESVLVDGNPVDFILGKEANDYMGASLSAPVTDSAKKVTIKYATSRDAEALQWLNPEQTAGKRFPFLFTQSQAILARSWIPVQDSPGIRFTYEAAVEVPSPLLALMSAENPVEKNAEGVYHFKMDQPIPAYLMALAVGDLEYRSISSQTGVYAEPSVIEAAAYEFADLGSMLTEAEELYGPYRWEKYDLIVLPPSFPFGGMENPRLTFVTPTILAGDRSLTSLVAHELAHSWSGNLVTNATWNDFWLNEGFTVYFERRIMEQLYGESYANMLAVLGFQDLQQTVKDLIEEGNAKDTRLKLSLEGRNPDDGVTDVAYEKGYSFLKLIEQKVGRERFDQFLSVYFDEKAFETMTTESFLEYLDENLFQKHGIAVSDSLYQQWVYGEGIPDNAPRVTSARFEKVDAALQAWKAGKPAGELETGEWSSHEWLHFIKGLPETMSREQMNELDDAFGFTQTGNSEMLVAWLLHAVKNNYDRSYERLEQFLLETGRRKFLVPLYGELLRVEEGRKMAMQIYQKARKNYHYVSTNTLDNMLGWRE